MNISINKKTVQIASAAIFGLSVVGILVSAAAYLSTHGCKKKKKKKSVANIAVWLVKLLFRVVF